MSLHESLHAAAVAVMALAAVVHPGLRHRGCTSDLIAGVCAIVAMADAMWLRSLPVVYSLAALLAAAMAMSALGSARARRGRDAGRGACERSHGPIGLVATAVCLPSMHGAVMVSGAAHAHHGLGAGAFTAVAIAICGCHVLVSVVAARRARPADRIQYLLMGAGTALMALAAAV